MQTKVIGVSLEEGVMLQCSLCFTVFKESLGQCPHCRLRQRNEFKCPKRKKTKTFADIQKKDTLKMVGKIKKGK